MHKIELEVSEELAEKVAPYRDRLSEVLQLGVQTLAERERQGETYSREMSLQKLAALGRITLPQAATDDEQRARRTPVTAAGKPASEIVIEQRGEL